MSEVLNQERGTAARIGLYLGPAFFLMTFPLPAPGGLSDAGWLVAGCALWIATWWTTQAIPINVTALLPLILFPLLGLASLKDSAVSYANPIQWIFLGGFIIAKAVEVTGLHKRLALTVLRKTGTSPAQIVMAFMGVAAFFSLWFTNTATTIMMVPIAASVALLVEGHDADSPESHDFAAALVLGVAFAASIGGIGTLIGTAPNGLMAGYLDDTLGRPVGFAEWMMVGVPLVIILVTLAAFALTRLAFKLPREEIGGARDIYESEYQALGPMTTAEKRVMMIAVMTVLLWVTRPILSDYVPGGYLKDGTIAVFGAMLLFIVTDGSGKPRPLLTWHQAATIPWGILLLFGGGLSLAAMISSSGLAAWIGGGVSLVGFLPSLGVVLIVTAGVVFLTELTSNTATTSVLIPILAAAAPAMGLDPLTLIIPMTVAASCAFMMPVATPPNAIVFATGHVTLPQMIRAGFILNLIAIPVIAVFIHYWMPLVLM